MQSFLAVKFQINLHGNTPPFPLRLYHPEALPPPHNLPCRLLLKAGRAKGKVSASSSDPPQHHPERPALHSVWAPAFPATSQNNSGKSPPVRMPPPAATSAAGSRHIQKSDKGSPYN